MRRCARGRDVRVSSPLGLGPEARERRRRGWRAPRSTKRPGEIGGGTGGGDDPEDVAVAHGSTRLSKEKQDPDRGMKPRMDDANALRNTTIASVLSNSPNAFVRRLPNLRTSV